jgi:hypothetical protein
MTHTYERSQKMYFPSATNTGNSTYKYIETFYPLNWQKDPWKDLSKILLLTGSAGGGKSRLAGEKIHGLMLRYPGAAGLIMRKTKDSLKNSSLLMMQRMVVGNDPRVLHVSTKDRFEYSNGSVLAYMGMSDPLARERLRSIGPDGGLDFVWMEEATEFVEEDYNEVLARMRGRAAPFTQIILSTNPDGPAHWINVRLILGGEASVYKSKAIDNRHNRDDYSLDLEKLTGVQRQRLVEGKWVTGSGVVFDTWEDDFNMASGKSTGNVTLEADYIPDGGEVVWAIDDGYSGKQDKATGIFTGRSHPRAIMLCQMRGDGTLAVFGESYKIETLAKDHLLAVRKMSIEKGWPMPDYVVRDRAAASLDGALSAIGINRVYYDRVDKDESIKEMRTWIAADQNDVRRLIAHPRVRHFRYEVAQFSTNKSGKIIEEHDHGPDAVRYLIWHEVYGVSPEVDIVTWSMVANNG